MVARIGRVENTYYTYLLYYTNTFGNLVQIILQVGQIHLSIWTNTVGNFDKYSWQWLLGRVETLLSLTTLATIPTLTHESELALTINNICFGRTNCSRRFSFFVLIFTGLLANHSQYKRRRNLVQSGASSLAKYGEMLISQQFMGFWKIRLLLLDCMSPKNEILWHCPCSYFVYIVTRSLGARWAPTSS